MHPNEIVARRGGEWPKIAIQIPTKLSLVDHDESDLKVNQICIAILGHSPPHLATI